MAVYSLGMVGGWSDVHGYMGEFQGVHLIN